MRSNLKICNPIDRNFKKSQLDDCSPLEFYFALLNVLFGFDTSHCMMQDMQETALMH
jgi:hypothetical protein